MSDDKNVDNPQKRGKSEVPDTNIAVSSSEVSSVAGSVQTAKTHPRVSSSSDRQIKFERAQKCLENAALVSKRIKEHRKATAELLGRPFEDDDVGDTASEMASTMSEKTGYSVATDTSGALSVQDALNIPGISESLANTLKQKELLMERIKQYKEISKRPMKTTPVARKDSTADVKAVVTKSKDSPDVSQLVNTLKEKENALSVIQVKMKAMETTILELQEKITEKDQIIEAKNRATTLMSDSLSKKEKDSLSLLEDTRQQMIKMQENFINMELEWKEEKNRLLKQIEEKDEKISSLEEANTILENSRFEISVANSKLLEELELKNKEISELQDKIDKMSYEEIKHVPELTQKEREDVEEEKGSLEIANMVELTKKIELLEQLNCQIRQTNKELENKLANMNTESKAAATSSPSKKGSPLPTRKGARNTSKKSPWSQLSSESLPQEVDKKPSKNEVSKLEMVVQSLNKEILDKEYMISQKDALISELQTAITENETIMNELKSQVRIQANLVEVGVITDEIELLCHSKAEVAKHYEPVEGTISDAALPKEVKELEEKLKAAQDQIAALNTEIDAANKNMIKVKSNHKLKLKQMQKTIDNFSKVSDANAEIVKLNEELHQLSQKVAELEEEKGNLQLHLVDYDSGRLTESDVYKKMVEMENLAETRLKSISVLEAQKFDLVQELHELQQKNVEMEDKLADMSHLQSEQVSSEMKSVQLEEQIDQLSASTKELELVIENLKLDKEQLEGTIKSLEEEKQELLHKLENYIQENMELTDKLEKLSAEKVSSAESIEIVESLTTQEKLELEEYNKGLPEHKIEDSHADMPVTPEYQENIENLVEQSAELNKKIELFTQERQEVLEKMSKISSENESLQQRMTELSNQCDNLQSNIELLTSEKQELSGLNEELNRQIEELKRERLEIMKESIEIVKPTSAEDTAEGIPAETQHDDKTTGEKGNNRTKSVKQLTKDILKLKNTIKEREAEIGDCQMKILSLEEQQQKYNELLQINSGYESKVKALTDENYQLREELDNVKKDKISEQQLVQYKQTQDLLQQEIQKLQHDFAMTTSSRDARIQELESLLVEYEKQIFNYGTTLQQKDKEMAEYVNQITKLNDVSQKLRSTIEVLEEEKAKDPNAELVKTLNKQIAANQKKLAECEDKLKKLEEEKAQLLSVNVSLENKNVNLDSELKKLQDAFTEKQNLIKELQIQQQKYSEEMSNVKIQLKERDEEVHEIKLQLRKESIENEKLRSTLAEKETHSDEYTKELQEAIDKVKNLTDEKVALSEQCTTMETKNKELMDKLKKFAASVKKKSSMYAELEGHMSEKQKELEAKTLQVEQLLIQVETLPALQEKLKYAEEELNRLQSQRLNFEQQKSQDILNLQTEIQTLQDRLATTLNETSKINHDFNETQQVLYLAQDENAKLKLQIDTLSNKLADYEVEQKNNLNFITKVSSLEADISQKQMQIAELLSKLEHQEQLLSQLQFGQDAKIQERDLYIESLETEINKYKNRICRLEESISIMEDRRHTLERKADQLDTQLQEKQKAYSEYTSQEDQLVGRLAVLMDHDRVVEKQLHEIENENKELQHKTHHLSEENQRLRKSLSDIQDHCNTLVDKASRTDFVESELAKYQSQLHELDAHLKRLTHEHQNLLVEKKREIEEIEAEFNTQIENSIREKKTLSEKYEKINEHVTQLESRLQEYRNNIETLKINNEELNRINQDLVENSAREQSRAPDYTEQYINEINKLNSIVNNKNENIHELNNKLQTVQSNNIAIVSNLESKIAELNERVQYSSTVIDQLVQESNTVRASNEHLQTCLLQKDEQIRRLTEEKSVTFEMTIPKTEGMVISSTIEPLREGSREFDVSSIESQIVSESEPVHPDKHVVKRSEQHQTSPDKAASSGEIQEPEIVAKKAYLCYKGEEGTPEQSDDPFNSDEGWGLGECEEIGEVTPGMTHLTDQIQQLKKQNESLKADLDASNNKLMKALKKLKELKSNNEMLSNELKISKQISQTSFLDSAIEDEMKINIQELEKKVQELTADINKEKREKEALRKQNEVFNNANDKLTEMKEKLDNEIELWKYKFKEANDKMSTLQWGADSKDSPDHKTPATTRNPKDDALREEIIKLEKENDELQTIIDQLSSQNKELSSQQTQLSTQVMELNKQLQENKSTSETYDALNTQLLELQAKNNELQNNNDILNKKIQDLEIQYKETNEKNEELIAKKVKHNDMLIETIRQLEEESIRLKETKSEAGDIVHGLISELETAKTRLQWHEERKNDDKVQDMDVLASAEKYRSLEDYCSILKRDLEKANNKLMQVEAENMTLLEDINEYKKQIEELNSKLEQLNIENDQLLSTVAELRSSVSSAVDQRGFEIAELWKQHLAQRETDFQRTEQELRSQLSASEAKYEQLLDSVQSSTQEETNQLVMMEQITSLQNKLQDKEEHLRNLQDKYVEVMNQIDMLRSEMEDEKVMYENKLLGQQEEYEKQIKELASKNQEHTEGYEAAYHNLQSELATTKTTNDELNQQVQELLGKVKESEENILELTNQLRLKDSEIYQKTHDFTITLTQRNEEFETVRKQLLELEKKVEDLTYEKESELAVLRLKMHEKAEDFERAHQDVEEEKLSLTQELNAKIIECTNLNKQLSDLNKKLEENASQTAEMQTALENQEMEIVTLSDEISNLQEILKNSKIEKHVTFASDTKAAPESAEQAAEAMSKELLDPVPRAELDLALYMLHQRDVRCEELTMELTQLLDERDTLQLRLSDSLRSYEELKSKCQSAGVEVSLNISQETIPESSFTVEKEQHFVDTHRGQTSRSSSISDPDGDKPKLQAKLSELRTVRHSRDVRLRHESEARQLDLRLLQRDVAHLPPEAREQLAQAHHTLSRDSQSTSTVLLNWLRGKSTPKVVHM
uniref:Protein lava lamp-like n=2 Tax=Pectinophora gossypiella TaxID=13191 RepID=A0A1E1WC66_PECGO